MTGVREIVYQAISWIIQYSTISATTKDGKGDQVAGRAQPDEDQYDYPVRRLWPFGWRSRPPAGCEAVIIKPNGSPSSGVLVGAESSQYGPSDLEEGEGALYCIKDGTLFKLDKDGNLIGVPGGSGIIFLGGPASDSAMVPGVLYDKLLQRIQNIEMIFNAHVQAPYSPPTTTMPGTPDFQATKVKVK